MAGRRAPDQKHREGRARARGTAGFRVEEGTERINTLRVGKTQFHAVRGSFRVARRTVSTFARRISILMEKKEKKDLLSFVGV